MTFNAWSKSDTARFDVLTATFKAADHYAVFDADGTLWNSDLTEALLALLEQKKRLTGERLPSSMRPVPLRKGESLLSYYMHLCQANKSLGYFWICRVFAGFSLGELKKQLNEVMEEGPPIPSVVMNQNGAKSEHLIERPAFFNWQKELIRLLSDNGIHVFVVTAGQEELVRMVVADPRYALGIPPEQVVGMRLALKSPSEPNSIAPPNYFSRAYFNSVLTDTLAGQTTWYVGKVAAIKEYIHPYRHPVLVVGNSESDLAMLHYAKPYPGLKLLVTETRKQQSDLTQLIQTKALQEQKENNRPPLNWEDWMFKSHGRI